MKRQGGVVTLRSLASRGGCSTHPIRIRSSAASSSAFLNLTALPILKLEIRPSGPSHLSKKLRLPGGSLTGMQSTGTMTPSSVAKTFAGRMSNTTGSSLTNAYAFQR